MTIHRGWSGGLLGIALAVLSGQGCRGAEAAPRSRGAVDSAVSRDTAIARFRRDLPRVDALAGGAGSRDELIRSFVDAVGQGDSATLHRLALTKAEFGWLYYPGNPEGLPPYDLTPQLMWFMLEGRGMRGLTRLLQTRSGTSVAYTGYRCEGEPGRYGGNTVWGPCELLRRGAAGDTVAERWFGQIVERGGRFKFVGYANELD